MGWRDYDRRRDGVGAGGLWQPAVVWMRFSSLGCCGEGTLRQSAGIAARLPLLLMMLMLILDPSATSQSEHRVATATSRVQCRSSWQSAGCPAELVITRLPQVPVTSQHLESAGPIHFLLLATRAPFITRLRQACRSIPSSPSTDPKVASGRRSKQPWSSAAAIAAAAAPTLPLSP